MQNRRTLLDCQGERIRRWSKDRGLANVYKAAAIAIIRKDALKRPMTSNSTAVPFRSHFSATVPLAFVVLIWTVFVVNVLFPFLHLNSLGILPRTFSGLKGVFFAPLLHISIFHLAANTIPFFVLLFLLNLQSGKRWMEVLIPIWLLSGIGTWIIGRGGYHHIGASGVIYGLLSYLVVIGFYHRDWKSIAIGLFVLVTYGGFFMRIFPVYWFYSWEGHLCGAVAGVVLASMNRKG